MLDNNRMKYTAQWFYDKVFKDEPIKPRREVPVEKLPSLLRTARSLENSSGNQWQSRESIFLKQAKLLANYEDDYPFHGDVVRYYPTYQALTDQELRGYFSWRTKWRKGNHQKTSLSFAFLYIYELINQVGVTDALEGFEKLTAFRDIYGAFDAGILSYLDKWITDYVIYYNLDPNLLADSKQVLFDRSICVLDLIQEQDDEKVMYAIKQLAPKWLSRSKFYGQNPSDCDRVIVRTLRRISDHYAKRTKKTMVEQFFGMQTQFQIRLFDAAVFCDPIKKRSFEYALDERCVYRCQGTLWTVTKHSARLGSNAKLEDILKTVDAIMREMYGYKHPIKCETDTKWITKIIREEVQNLLAEKRAAEAKKIVIDYSQLSKIRQEAAVTQEKLTVEEELEEPVIPEPMPAVTEEPEIVSSASEDSPLTGHEYHLLQCLLYGRDFSWVQKEGLMLSILSDSINDKLYDIFQDSVMDDSPALVDDYIDDLKEMVSP